MSTTVDSLAGGAVAVGFNQPTVTGGEPPVTVTCTPQSGSSFTVGTTMVACTARDSAQRTDSCGFMINVVVPPKLSATRLVAFGDSITQGSTGDCGPRDPHLALDWFPTDARYLRTHLVIQPYPMVLQTLLAGRYKADQPLVANEGLGGERVSESDTRDRLNAALTRHAAQAVLLLEGVNDLHWPTLPESLRIADMLDGLEKAVRLAKGRGVRVLVGTLLPERTSACRAFQPDLIAPANVQIRAMAAAENVVLVDLYAAFVGQLDTLLGQDGLHPTDAGYRRIAEVFFDAIRQELELTPRMSSLR